MLRDKYMKNDLKKKAGSMKWIKALFIFPVLVLMGCDSQKNVQVACPPLPVQDGYVTVKMKLQNGGGEMTLRLPDYVNIERSAAVYGECQYARGVDATYLWYEGKLLPGGGARANMPNDKFVLVHVGVRSDPVRLGDVKPRPEWHFTPAIKHKQFPLEYYPRSRWESTAGPRYRDQKDGNWGIRDTRHKNAIDGKPFEAWCSIDTKGGSSIADGEFAKDGDSKCRGGINAEKNGKVLGAMIDVWAVGAPEINHIYDAAYEQLQSFIQE